MNAYRWSALRVLAASALLVAGPFVGFTYAQNEPVYAVYDGFFVTDEGQYVLSFAYFSHNFEPVTVPVGPTNSFGPGPSDRQQPTTFLPGHRRFQCVMVMAPDFDGGLRWTACAGACGGADQIHG